MGGAAGTTMAGATIVITKTFAFANPLPGANAAVLVTTTGRASPTRPVEFSRAGQVKSISTAIRIRSEWFLAPSFCFSSEVVLATVL